MQKQLLNIIRKDQVVFLFKTFLLEHSQKCISLTAITIHSKIEKSPSCTSHTTNEMLICVGTSKTTDQSSAFQQLADFTEKFFSWLVISSCSAPSNTDCHSDILHLQASSVDLVTIARLSTIPQGLHNYVTLKDKKSFH